ncbi:MAG: type VI secretion system-associated FHA domain protein TagH [Spongiibacteraceae bacterium]
MNIKLTVIKAPESCPIVGQQNILSDGHTIGRGSNCDVVLVDTTKAISSNHATFTSQADRAILIDNSTNGTYLNNSTVAVGKGNQQLINSGDIIRIGDYQFSIEITHKPLLPAGLETVGFLDNTQFSVAIPTTTNRSSATPPPADSLDEFDRWLEPAASSQPLNAWGSSSIAPETITGGNPISTMLEEQPTDPLAILDNNANSFNNNVYSSAPLWDDPLPHKPTQDEQNNWWQSEADDSPANQMAMPNIAPVAVAAPVAAEATTQAHSHNTNIHANPTPNPNPNQAYEIAALLGLKGLSAEQLANLARSTTAIVRNTAGNLVNLLQARASIKNELRASRTIIRTSANNPLKFSAGADDALQAMFANSSDAFLNPEQAVKESFEDVADHQVAVLYAMKIAFNSMLSQFDPNALEKKLGDNKKGWINKLKPNTWDHYKQYYQQLQHDQESSYHQLFGEAFAQAYEDKQAELKLNRSMNQH